MKVTLSLMLLLLLATTVLADEDAHWVAVDQPDGSRVVTFDVTGKGGNVEVRTRAGETLRGPYLEAGKPARVTVVERPGEQPVVVIDRDRDP